MSKCSVSLYLNVGCHKRGIATGLGTHSQKEGNTFLAMVGSYEDSLWQGAASSAYTGYMQTAGNEAHYWGHTAVEDGPIRKVDKLHHVEIEERWGKGSLPVTSSGMGQDSSLRSE